MIAAEEKANMLPVKLSFPLVLFILPSIFVAVLTPAIIAIMRTFGTVAQ
jgi:tight adherence protein C